MGGMAVRVVVKVNMHVATLMLPAVYFDRPLEQLIVGIVGLISNGVAV
jgi:hypothetical protein